ncbi:MAG: tail fiber domain-containing protein [Microscillaceae bacterium]|nr:tail fiber domain-containing protein [Microscillaceae bacterium]
MRKCSLSIILFVSISSLAWAQCPSDCAGDNTRLGNEAGILNTGFSNVFVGLFAGRFNTSGSENTFLGRSSGQSTTTGSLNVFVGRSAGFSNTTGSNNTFVGVSAGDQNTTGSFNTFIGRESGESNTIGSLNVFIGWRAGRFNTTGIDNTFVGVNAGQSNTIGQRNTFVGKETGISNTTGGANVFMGWRAGKLNSTGNENTFLGVGAGELNTSGTFNTFVGRSAGNSNTSGGLNTFVGVAAGASNTIGEYNAFLGTFAGYNNKGSYNTFIGNESGFTNNDGASNTFVGYATGYFSTTALYNTFIGNQAGYNTSSGVSNTFIGNEAGVGNTVGQSNTALGYRAGWTNQTGSGNLFLGNEAGYNETSSNKLYIANDSTSNPLIYGDFSQKVVALNGALGVGIKNPARPIHLRATNAIFRIDRDRDDPGFNIVRYDNNFNNVWKSFFFYTRATGVNQGKFVIADWATNVSGPSTARLVIANNGNVGIGDFLFTNPSQKLTVSGNVLATGSFITSDKRFKRNIETIPSAMDRLDKINGVSYSYETQKFAERGLPEGKNLGLIAQEVEKVFPELVVEDAEGYKAVNYDGLIPVLIEALKEQKAEIDLLKEELKTLKNPSQESVNNKAQLFQNQPNPFDKSTLIRYKLPEGVAQAMILVTDLQGKEVNRLAISQGGEGSISLEAGSLAKGIYLYSLVADGALIDTKRMLIAD